MQIVDTVMTDKYKNIAAWYDTIFEPLNKGLRQIGLKMHPVKPGMNVLDIGCGTGEHLKLYQEQNCNIFGIDLSAAMLSVAANKLGEKVQLKQCDAVDTRFTADKFDLILLSTVLHEMPHHKRVDVLNEVKRILKKDGKILLIDFHPGPLLKLKGYYFVERWTLFVRYWKLKVKFLLLFHFLEQNYIFIL